ncbi:MAG: DUF5659 domain-containing protein [Clostridium sp.]|uniref:DUF5659 domain-containing protein n=1 Tax=Clostridium sp. TaxID=1506 RepID=UPI003EE5EF84
MKRIFKMWLANELINRGFEIVKHEVYIKNPRLKVFLFEDTEELNMAIMDIMNSR